jgi:hypothetical protein
MRALRQEPDRGTTRRCAMIQPSPGKLRMRQFDPKRSPRLRGLRVSVAQGDGVRGRLGEWVVSGSFLPFLVDTERDRGAPEADSEAEFKTIFARLVSGVTRHAQCLFLRIRLQPCNQG